MKTKKILLIVAIMLGVNFNIMSQSNGQGKMLVVYFSYSGNTEEVAKQIQVLTGADIFEIIPVKDYPSDYKNCTEQAKQEINSNFKPTLKSKIDNIGEYDVIFVGSPCWWSTIAPPVATFLSDYNFDGKKIVPFMTHEGSFMGRSISDIKKLCPKSEVSDGLTVKGGEVKNSKETVMEKLKQLEIIK